MEQPTREFLPRQLADDGFEVFAADRAAAAIELVDRRAGRAPVARQ